MISPITTGEQSSVFNADITSIKSFSEQIAIIPIPQLNVFKASEFSKPASFISQLNIGNLLHESRFILAPNPSGNALGKFSVNPPPVM